MCCKATPRGHCMGPSCARRSASLIGPYRPAARSIWHEPKAILVAAPDAPRAAVAAKGEPKDDECDGGRHRLRFLGIGTLLSGLPFALRGIALDDLGAAARGSNTRRNQRTALAIFQVCIVRTIRPVYPRL